ncbi:hypothetical protein BLNAU_6744 [Blattamonas nauphoetae]|uniref:Uncharacterized protein n=1 Tax=Blattamonas nauphoetae TaxID=2049346 RepID=A0ABQ9Y3E2_9EUKA|nr:hypothetical protein BLNAU_6744 [Blattamonas nauphoetae]
MSKVIAISVNGGPFLGTERNKSTTYVNINLTTIRIEIGKLMHPMKAPYQEFLKSLGMTVAEEECIEAHVNRDAQQDIKSAIQVSLCDITETNLDQIPQIRISNNRIGLLSFTCLQLRKDEVKMDEKESSYNIPLTFADRLARITGHSPDSSQIDPHRNSTLKTGQKTRTISILVERNYKVFGTWAKAFSDRLESHCAPQKHGHQPFV